MDIIDISRKAIVLNKEEIEKMIQVYKYIRHRIFDHPGCGAKYVDIKYVDYVLHHLETIK